MKVSIGPYKNWVGPYQIAETLCWWVKPIADEHGFKSKPDWVHNFGTWLSGGENGNSVLLRVCQWAESKRKRKIRVKIHSYDTWSMESTLAYIALPMLKQLRATKHGAPFTDDCDVPEELRSTSAPVKENEWDTDAYHFARWNYILDQMIVAFESKTNDSWEDQYRTGTHDIAWIPSKLVDKNGVPLGYEMVDGPNNTFKCDYNGLKLHQTRITNGFRLFGKYYENLWD